MALGLLTGSDQAGYIKRFCRGNLNLYLKQCNADGTALSTGDGTLWQALGILKGTTVENQITEYSDTDDSGKKVVDEETIESYDINGTLMQRDKATLQLHQNVAGNYYIVALRGQLAPGGTLVEAWAFGPAKVSQKFSYNIGDTAQASYNISTISNPASISVTLPSGISTGSVTIAAGAMAAVDYVAA